MTRVTLGLILALVTSAPVAAAQVSVTRVRAAFFTETYSFDEAAAFSDSLPFRRINEMTVPIGFDIRLGRFADLSVATGWARVQVRSKDQARLADQEVSGLRDTELRLGVNVIPGRLIVLATGVLPTGQGSIEQSQVRLLGAISSDVIGFAAPSIGSGGSVGGGFAGAVPLGRFALGLGATYRLPLTYEPIIGQTTELKPGAEFRLRAGVEGPLGRMTYLRVAGVFALRGRDELASQEQAGVGNRLVGYVSVNQQAGPVALTLYGFDVYRGSPQTEGTPAGAAVLPKGNLLAFGSRVAIPVGSRMEITPRGEFRVSTQEASPEAGFRRLGNSLRFGVDVRRQITPRLAGTLQLGGLTGDVFDVGLTGTRAAVHFELTP